MKITWCVEREIFVDRHTRLINAVHKFGYELIEWNDDWLITKAFPNLSSNVIFHGSLGNANLIKELTGWNPAAFCASESFFCSSWYLQWKKWLVHQKWMYSTVSEFVDYPSLVFEILGNSNSVFVRPDSPLKPFSGRVLNPNKINFAAFDYGFYYEDRELPIVIAPVVDIQAEYRFVIADRKVIAGSTYDADGRKEGKSIKPLSQSWQYAQLVVAQSVAPEIIYILDVCMANNIYYVLELNPFSGSDLYCCDREAIVEGVSKIVDNREII